MDEQEKIERRAHIRLIITEALMFLAVLFLVGFLTLIVMGYSFNLRELGGSGEVLERSGLVQISSLPTGATIYIDGEAPLLLSTNASRTMLAGEHEISLAKGGFDGWKKTIRVTEGMMYRLNYPRLFKEERETEEVMRFYKPAKAEDRIDKTDEEDAVKTYAGKISFVRVSPNNERMLIMLDGMLYLMNLNDNKPALKTLEIPNMDSVDIVKVATIESAEWSGNSERMLALINGEWAVLNVRDSKDTFWVNKVIKKNDIRDIKFESEIGDRLLILNTAGELVELNIKDGKLSEVLVDGVDKFDNDGDRVVYLTKFNSETRENVLAGESTPRDSEWQVRAYRVGDSESYVIRRFELEQGEELGSVRVATMRYFQEGYVGIAHGVDFEVYSKTGWMTSDDEMEKVFSEKESFDIAKIRKRGKGMVFEMVGSDGDTVVFDIEAMATARVDTKDTGWIDEFMRFRLIDGKLSVLDYDGLNERVLVKSKVMSGRVVAISGNGRYLYYFSDATKNTEDGMREVLVRERIN
ncbi:PEGA domain-containing protein [Candidatus Saccharibacteria bacterium]|nr:PEGA domain-containing protein [Candidatus Saccharibacteria bacterium]